MNDELKSYEKIGDWDFSQIQSIEEDENKWDFYEEIKKYSNERSLILDLGTGGGESVLSNMPEEVGIIIGIDFSSKMMETANNNLKKYPNKRVKFIQMNNLDLKFPNNMFDIVTARHTKIDAKQIFKCLAKNGVLIIEGVDKYDCWELKEMFGRGQAYNDDEAISKIDYEDIKKAGFKEIELVEIKCNEYFKTKDDLLKLLLKTPILDDFLEIRKCENIYNDKIESEIFENYVQKYSTNKGILLKRRYYGIVAKK